MGGHCVEIAQKMGISILSKGDKVTRL